MSFQEAIVSLAARTNSLYTFDEEEKNVAYLIERGKGGKPSESVWRKTFIFREGKVTIKVHGKTLAIKPLSALA